MEALFLYLKYVDDNGYYFDNGYDNNKQKNYGNYEDGDDFFMFCMQKLWNRNLTLMVLLVLWTPRIH